MADTFGPFSLASPQFWGPEMGPSRGFWGPLFETQGSLIGPLWVWAPWGLPGALILPISFGASSLKGGTHYFSPTMCPIIFPQIYGVSQRFGPRFFKGKEKPGQYPRLWPGIFSNEGTATREYSPGFGVCRIYIRPRIGSPKRGKRHELVRGTRQ